jgi:hypothetical protein
MTTITKDAYAYEIIQSLAEHRLGTDEELAQIKAYLVG